MNDEQTVSPADEIEQMQAQIAEYRSIIAQGEAMERLVKTADFRTLIMEGYCRDECARNIGLSTELSLTAETRDRALRNAQSGGHLRTFLSTIIEMGRSVRYNLQVAEDQLDELRAESA